MLMYNNFSAPYVPNLGNGQGWGGGFVQPAPQPVQQRGNKIYVVDAKDALSRAAMPDSLMVYIQQDESAMHEVYMDAEGRKMIRTRSLIPVEAVQSGGGDMVTRKEFEELRAAVEAMRGGVAHAE
jgi:hypothetical protein